jgi:hypothetical protein
VEEPSTASKADICGAKRNVRFVPIADIVEVLLELTVSITPSAQAFAAKIRNQRKSGLTPDGVK